MIRFINAHTHNASATNNETIAIQNIIIPKDPEINGSMVIPHEPFCSVGIHPWYIADESENQFAELRQFATLPNVRAIGECGLDRLRGPALSIQQVVFERQIQLSEEVQKPLIVHCVRAFQELLVLHKRLKPTQRWLLHGVNNRLSAIQPLLNAGLYMSFGTALLRPDTPARQVLLAAQPDKLLLETDDQDMPIERVYEAAAEQLGWSMERLTSQVGTNAARVFGL